MSAHRIVRFPALDDADEDATNIISHLEGLSNEGWTCFHREGLTSVVGGAYRHEHQLWLRRVEPAAPAVVNVNNVSSAADPGRTIHNVFAMPDGTLALSEPYATEDEARLRANAGSFVCAVRLETTASAEMVRWPGIQSALFRLAPGPDEGAIADLLRKLRRYGLPCNGGAELAVHVPVAALDAAESELVAAQALTETAWPIDAAPIDMILFCPACGAQHVDAPEPDKGWDNPPHRSHLCAGCGHVWRPADVPTNGVAGIRTVGTGDTANPVRGLSVAPVAAIVEDPAVAAWTFRPTHRHFKGGLYQVVGTGHLALAHLSGLATGFDRAPVTIYRDEAGVYVRPTDEFDEMMPDGTPRFQRLVQHTVVEVKPKET